MAKLIIQGVDSINDFWCYKNGNRDPAYIASGDGVREASVEWSGADNIEINVRYFTKDFMLFRIGFSDYGKYGRIYLVRDHAPAHKDGDKWRYYLLTDMGSQIAYA